MMKIRTLISKYIIKPTTLILKNFSIILIFSFFLVIDRLTPNKLEIKASLNPEWFFESIPNLVLKVVSSPTLIAMMALLFLLKSCLIVLVGRDLLEIFSGNRKSMIQTIKSVKATHIIWFLKSEFIIYIIFGLIAILSYWLAFLIYSQLGYGKLALLLLMGLFIVLFPLFYFNISICSTLSVFPLTSTNKYNKLSIFYKWKNLLQTYTFYGVRLTIEYIFILLLPALALIFIKSKIIASMLVLIGLVLPLLILRTSAYVFKLNILKNDPDIKNIFYKHFESEK